MGFRKGTDNNGIAKYRIPATSDDGQIAIFRGKDSELIEDRNKRRQNRKKAGKSINMYVWIRIRMQSMSCGTAQSMGRGTWVLSSD